VQLLERDRLTVESSLRSPLLPKSIDPVPRPLRGGVNVQVLCTFVTLSLLSAQVVPCPGEVLEEPVSMQVLTELGASGTLDTLTYLIAHPRTSAAMTRSPAWGRSNGRSTSTLQS
jgi:hypothetical protein